MSKFDFENYRFENLEVWKLGMKIIHEIYKIVKNFQKKSCLLWLIRLKELALL